MAFTYILLTAGETYYIGSTNDIDERLKEHQNGRVKSTKSKLPVKLVYLEKFDTRAEAQKQEYRIKRWKSRKLIESLIRKSPNNLAPSSIG
ncbi:MAG: GIY-YIG nuclease family protein [Patescibacteria group bacterium]